MSHFAFSKEVKDNALSVRYICGELGQREESSRVTLRIFLKTHFESNEVLLSLLGDSYSFTSFLCEDFLIILTLINLTPQFLFHMTR